MEIMEKEENERKKVESLKVSDFSFPELSKDTNIGINISINVTSSIANAIL